jgi:3-oxoadipate enol-lactonase
VARSAEGVAGLADAALDRWFTPSFQERRPEEVERFRQMLITTAGEGYAGCCEAIRDMDLRGRLSAIAAPTLVLAGSDDPSTPKDKVRPIADAIDGAGFVVIDGAAHIANMAQPDAFNRAVLGHLKDAR